MKKIYSNRRWLNSDKTQTAFIAADISAGGFGVSGDIKIADCSKIINLDLWCENKKEARSRLRKLDILIGELFNVREVIHDHFYGDEDE